MNVEVQAIIIRYHSDKSRLIDMLWDIQHQFGCISDEAVGTLSEILNMSPLDVRETITFYHFFHDQPFGKHKITQDFNVSLQFGMSRSVKKAPSPPEETEITELCYTSESAWAETDLKRLKERNEVELENSDIKGPVPLVVTAEIKKPETLLKTGIKPEKEKPARIVIAGNAAFLTNTMLGVSGNLNFTLNTFNWLLEDENQITIKRTIDTNKPETIVLSSTGAMFVMVFSIFFIPLLSILIGIRVYLKRKNMS